jgi:serine phosphatase RsbU (regulator of sigma subunit)/ligand-binding sensor domain-containing protein
MKYLRLSLSILAVLLLSLHLTAQNGSPFITNFYTEDASLNENYSICQDKDGVIVIANRKGILTFDAEEWKLIKTPELPMVVAFDAGSNMVFAGCRNNIGYLQKSVTGEYGYKPLLNEPIGNILQVCFTKDYACFLSSFGITIVDKQKQRVLKNISNKTDFVVNKLLCLNNQLFANIAGKGLFLLKDSVLTPYLDKKTFPLNDKILVSVPYDSKTLLVGCSDNKLYLYDGKNTRNFEVEDQQYLNEGSINDVKIVSDTVIVVSTMNSGCLILHKNGKTLSSLNSQGGLPNDEIFAMGADCNQGIWLAHYYGLTRIDLSIPVKNFTYYKGLTGTLSNIGVLNNKLFVSSGNGIFFLEKKSDYVEYQVATVEPVIQPFVQAVAVVPIPPSPAPVTETKPVEKAKKRGFLGLFKSKKTEEPKVTDELQPKQEVIKQEEPLKKNGLFARIFSKKEAIPQQEPFASISDKFQRRDEPTVSEKKKVYKLKSVSHSYQQVPGFNHRCRQLISEGGKLLAATSSGVFEITEKKVVPVWQSGSVNYVYYVPEDKTWYLCTDKGLYSATYKDNKWQINDFGTAKNENVFSFAKDFFGNYWVGCESKVYKVKLSNTHEVKTVKEFPFPSEYREGVMIRISKKRPVFFISNKVYSIFSDTIRLNKWLSKYTKAETKYYFGQQNVTWIRNDRNWVCLTADSDPDSVSHTYMNLFTNVTNVFADQEKNLWVIDNNTLLYKLNIHDITRYKSEFSAFIKSFTGVSGETFSLKGVELDKNNHSLKIRIGAPFFIRQNSNQYQYIVEGVMNEWSSWSTNPVIDVVAMSSGTFKVKVRARNIFGNLSDEKMLSFKIRKAFYETIWFAILMVFALLVFIILVIKFRERELRRKNQYLEQKVHERTIEILHQKDEIEDQRNQIFTQKKEMTDSIEYASRIQRAMLPSEEVLNETGLEHFVLYHPRDIVSGDFYWMRNYKGKLIIAAADCTGHGVPGAFMSMLGMAFMNQIVREGNFETPGKILDLLRAQIIKSLHQNDRIDATRDGMDMSLVIFDISNKILQFAGAFCPIYITRGDEIIEAHADRMPVGYHDLMETSFKNHTFELQPGDVVYMFSDGFVDQFGGSDKKKFMTKRFKKTLLELSSLPIEQQEQRLKEIFNTWRGNLDQVDDVMVLAFRV